MSQSNPIPSLAKIERWIFDEALPLWGSEGFEGHFGFSEALDLNGCRKNFGFKRSRVHARQIYVFSHAHELGYEPGLEKARAGVSFLLEHGWSPETGGWVVSMGETGGIVNGELDLYEQAFVIFALSWWFRVSGDASVLPWIERTLSVIDEQFKAPSGIGYRSRVPDLGGRLQNPHMHLLEALLVYYEQRPTEALKQRIHALLAVFEERLFDPQTSTLAEMFDDDWTRKSFADGQKIEPGHHFEWCWLLSNADRLLGTNYSQHVHALFGFAERYGVRADTHLIYDGLDDRGAVIDNGHRSWPQTERLKALIAMHESHDVHTVDQMSFVVETLFQYYLSPAPSGAWIDHVNFDGSSRSDKVPASTFYHIFLSFAELKRYAAKLAAEPQTVLQ